MNKLMEAFVKDRIIRGENGMPVHDNSGSKLLDAFFRLGASRKAPDAEVLKLWIDAWNESNLGALRLAFYNRDVRGGQGERRSFRIFYKWLCNTYPKIAVEMIPHVPFYGRWDDLWVCTYNTPVWDNAVAFIASALTAKDELAAKWMPRERKAYNHIAKAFMGTWELTERQYRKLITNIAHTVEMLMCQKKWAEINYNHVPSKAAQKYRKAFYKRDSVRYAAYVAALAKGEKGVKVNAGAIYPNEILMPLFKGTNSLQEKQLVKGQWAAQPDYVGDEIFLTMVDTSGSMTWEGGEPFRVSVALGLYLSERAKGPFKDAFVTFETRPTFHYFPGDDILERFKKFWNAPVGGSTDFEAALKLILSTAVKNHVPAKDMPTTLLVLSDMQFNSCVIKPSAKAMEMIEEMYRKAGYKRPNIIFWNLRSAAGVPVKYDEQGTALVSGYSPSIMKTVFKGSNPLEVLIATLSQERYERIEL